MFRARRSRAEPVAVATSQELLRAALQRSARRNARVAGGRVAWRWLLWGLGHLMRLGGIAMLLAAVLGGAWMLWQGHVQRNAQTATLPASRATPPAPASAAAAHARLPEPPPPAHASAPAAVTADTPTEGARLRLDESVTPIDAPPAAQSDTKSNPNRPTTP